MKTLQEVTKGDSVILCAFTGMKMARCTIVEEDKKTITIQKKNGSLLVFNRKTGKQENIAPEKERYANSVIPDDGSYTPPNSAKKSKKEKK